MSILNFSYPSKIHRLSIMYTRLVLSFIGLISFFILYRQMISSVVDYDSLSIIMATCTSWSLFSILSALLMAFALTVIRCNYWILGIILSALMMVPAYYLFNKIMTHPLDHVVGSHLIRSYLLIIWIIGVTSPFTFFKSMQTFTRDHLHQLTRTQKNQVTPENHIVWSKVYQNSSSEFMIYVIILGCILATMYIIFAIIHFQKGVIYPPVTCMILSITGWLFFRYQRVSTFKPIHVSIPKDTPQIIMQGMFLGTYKIEVTEIAHIQMRAWTQSSSSSSPTFYSILEILLWDGGILELIHTLDLNEREQIKSTAHTLAKHFGVEMIESNEPICTWKSDFQKHDKQAAKLSESHNLVNTDSELLHIQHESSQTIITYCQKLRSIGVSFLIAMPFLYSFLAAGVSGLLVTIILDISSTLVSRVMIALLIYLIVGIIMYVYYKKNVRSLHSQYTFTLEDRGLTFTDGYDTYSIEQKDLTYIRMKLDLNNRSACLFLGVNERADIEIDVKKDENKHIDGMALIEIKEGWFQGKVEELQVIEKLIEQKYMIR